MSTTAGFRTVTIDYGCPDWCERPDHDADKVAPGEPAYHYGPDFGRYVSVMGVGHPLGLTVGEWTEMTAADLRDLAADALAAAEWLQAH